MINYIKKKYLFSKKKTDLEVKIKVDLSERFSIIILDVFQARPLVYRSKVLTRFCNSLFSIRRQVRPATGTGTSGSI